LNKKKIFNDPVYGFVTINSDMLFDIIEHPVFQRLRRIKQLGLTDFVYPGALHTRFHHAIGAMHLMGIALENLRSKGHEISKDEFEASQIAILLHDIGHGPFSHALEYSLLKGIKHEQLSHLLMKYLNEQFNGKLDLCIKIFCNTYERKFFHQLVSSQLDVDRLDYLKRDSFFTGVIEGKIGADRILKMLDIKNDQIVIEEKGIYSIENFLNARRLMYWQVYLHKATVSSEKMLIQLIRRAKFLEQSGENIFASPGLKIFLQRNIVMNDFLNDRNILEAYASLDDYDIWGAVKIWAHHPDFILSTLSKMLLNRNLFRVILSNERFERDMIHDARRKIMNSFPIKKDEVKYLLVHGSMSNYGYISGGNTINILTKDGEIMDVAKASDLPNIKAITKIVKKYYLCFPKLISL
jgi:uncharacterized protein